MVRRLRLAERVLFTELPFCGVLLDRRDLRLFRLSQPASAALRTALHGGAAGGPYDCVTPVEDGADTAIRDQVVRTLLAQGLLRSVDDD